MAELWSLVGPPLRPGREDIAAYESAIVAWAADFKRPPRAAVLGVTPELHGLAWPAGTSLVGLDRSLAMIRSVWPGGRNTAICGSWTTMPFADGSFDILVCDGGVGVLTYPDVQAAFIAEMSRVLAQGGIAVIRLFAPGGRTGTLDEVRDDLRAGRIASLDQLKLRLWGALHRDPREGVRPRRVVEEILAAVGDFETLSRDFGWPLAHVRSLELHRNSTASYHLIDVAGLEHMALHEAGGFESASTLVPGYPLGPCCPIVTLRRGPPTANAAE